MPLTQVSFFIADFVEISGKMIVSPQLETYCGLGGMGKTQLSIYFAGRFADTYSLFWLNAKDESTPKPGWRHWRHR